MASALNGQGSAKATLSFPFSNAIDLDTAIAPALLSLVAAFTAGTGANQVNKIWHDRRTLSAGTDEDLDLSGSLTNIFGETVAFTGVKALAIFNRATTASILAVSPTASTGMVTWLEDGSVLNIAPQGFELMVNPTAGGFGVTATTADQINLDNTDGSNPIDYDIFVVGIG